MSGSLVLGVLVGSAAHHGVSGNWLTVAGTGLIGAYTTFSTMQLELLDMWNAHHYGLAAGYLGAGVVCGYVAVHVSTALARGVRVSL